MTSSHFHYYKHTNKNKKIHISSALPHLGHNPSPLQGQLMYPVLEKSARFILRTTREKSSGRNVKV